MPLSRHIFGAPTRFYKTGVVFMAWLNGHQDHFVMVGGQQSTRNVLHLSELFRLADARRAAATTRNWPRAHDAAAGHARHRRAGGQVSAPPPAELLSLNTATVREQWNLRQMIDGCARHGIRGISPWRDKLGRTGRRRKRRG